MSKWERPRSGIWALAILIAAGCDSNSSAPRPPSQPFKGVTLVAATVGDPAVLSTLSAQRGEWSATRGAEVTVQAAPMSLKSNAGVDVLLVRGDRLGDLIDAGFLQVVPERAARTTESRESPDPADATSSTPPEDPVRFSEIVPAYREQVSKYGGFRMALPYGGSALVLAFRREAFEREENRAAAKDAKLVLEPPRTWEQFDALAKFFQGRDWDGDGKPDSGVSLAMNADEDGLGESIFLARAASLGQHRDQYSFLFKADSMAPRIDSPPFVESLRDLIALKAFGPPDLATSNAEAARRAFSEGRAAMLIDRAECAGKWGDKTIGVSPLPGSGRVYNPARKEWETVTTLNQPSYLPYGGGWLVGVSSSAKGAKLEAAIDFARYLIGPDTANRVRADTTTPMLAVRSVLLGQGPADARAVPGLDVRQWSDAVSRTLLAERVVPGLRIPGTEGYLADLSKGRLAAVEGRETIEQALEGVAKAWAERTRNLGVKRQLWHYRRSLNNSLVTTPGPPRADPEGLATRHPKWTSTTTKPA